MSNPQTTEKKSGLGFPVFSSLRKMISGEDPANPPPKEMKLGNSGKQRYDEEKKRWIFDGEEIQETQEVLPPPKTFLRASAPPSTIKRMYVDVLESQSIEKPYQPANFEENYEDLRDEIVEAKRTQEALKINSEDKLGSNFNDEKEMRDDIFNQYVPLESLTFEGFESGIKEKLKETKDFSKYKNKIRGLKEKNKFLMEYVAILEENTTEIIGNLGYSNDNRVYYKDSTDIQLLTQLENSKQGIMTLEAQNFSKAKDFMLLQTKYDKLKEHLHEKINEFESNLKQEKERYSEQIFELELIINEKNTEIRLLKISSKEQESEGIRLIEKIREIETDLDQISKCKAHLEVDLTKTTYEVSILKEVNNKNFEIIKNSEINQKILEEKLKFLNTMKCESPEISDESWKELCAYRNASERLQKKLNLYNYNVQRENELQNMLQDLLEDNRKLKESNLVQLDAERNAYEVKLMRSSNELAYEKLIVDQLKSQILLYKNELLEKKEKFIAMSKTLGDTIKKLQEYNRALLDKYRNTVDSQKSWKNEIKHKDNQIEHLKSAISKLEYEISTYDSKIDMALEQSQKYQSKYKRMKAEFQDSENKIESLKNQLVSQKNFIESLTSELSTLRKSNNSITEQELQLETQVQQHKKELSEFKEREKHLIFENEVLISKIGSAEDKLSEGKETIIHLSHENEELISKIKSSEYEFKNKIDDLHIKYQEQLKSKDVKTEDLNLENKRLEEFIDSLNNKINFYENQISSSSSNLLTIHERTQQITNELSELNIKNKQLTHKLSESNMKNISLQEEISTASQQSLHLSHEINRLTEENTDLQQELSHSTSILDKNALEISFLLQKIDDNSSMISHLNSLLEQKTTEISFYKAELESKLLEEITAKTEARELQEKQSLIIQTHEERIKNIIEATSSSLLPPEIEIDEIESKNTEHDEELTAELQRLKEYAEELENQIAWYREQLDLKEIAILDMQKSRKIYEGVERNSGDVGNEDLSSLEKELVNLREKDKNSQQDIINLNSEIECLYEEILKLQQKQKSAASSEGTMKEKDEEIRRYVQRLKEKDEELQLAKDLYQAIMKRAPENLTLPELITSEEATHEESFDFLPNINLSPEQHLPHPNNGWISTILSAVFLTDSERGEKQ